MKVNTRFLKLLSFSMLFLISACGGSGEKDKKSAAPSVNEEPQTQVPQKKETTALFTVTGDGSVRLFNKTGKLLFSKAMNELRGPLHAPPVMSLSPQLFAYENKIANTLHVLNAEGTEVFTHSLTNTTIDDKAVRGAFFVYTVNDGTGPIIHAVNAKGKEIQSGSLMDMGEMFGSEEYFTYGMYGMHTYVKNQDGTQIHHEDYTGYDIFCLDSFFGFNWGGGKITLFGPGGSSILNIESASGIATTDKLVKYNQGSIWHVLNIKENQSTEVFSIGAAGLKNGSVGLRGGFIDYTTTADNTRHVLSDTGKEIIARLHSEMKFIDGSDSFLIYQDDTATRYVLLQDGTELISKSAATIMSNAWSKNFYFFREANFPNTTRVFNSTGTEVFSADQDVVVTLK